jgi:uncharacterized membrane protein YfcA
MKDLVLFLVGIAVGGMNAIAGGGMLIGFPVLLAAGLSPLVANVTSNLVILPGQISSAFGYRNYLRKVPRQYMILLIPCAIGAVIGALILRNTPSSQFEQLVPVLILFAVVLFTFQPFLHHYLHKHLRSRAKRVQPLLVICVALLPMAVYGGYFGAGFGFIMLAFLGFTKLHETHQMNALKNVASAVIAGLSLACLFDANLINWHYGLVMAAGNLVGGYAGARMAQRIPSHALRTVVITIGVITTSYLFVRSY